MDSFDKMSSARNSKRDKEWYFRDSKKRFTINANKKMETCYIGIISLFEEKFGSIWGHGLKDMDRSEKQLKNKKVWDSCRQQILDHANKERRGLHKEIDEYEFYWKRHNIGFQNENDGVDRDGQEYNLNLKRKGNQ